MKNLDMSPLTIIFNICFGAQKNRLIEYPQHVLVENRENYFSNMFSLMLVCALIILEIQLFEAFSPSFLCNKMTLYHINCEVVTFPLVSWVGCGA